MFTNYFEDLWKKAEKLGVSKRKIGCEVFGEKYYRYIYCQGRVSEFTKKRYQEIDTAINKLAGRK